MAQKPSFWRCFRETAKNGPSMFYNIAGPFLNQGPSTLSSGFRAKHGIWSEMAKTMEAQQHGGTLFLDKNADIGRSATEPQYLAIFAHWPAHVQGNIIWQGLVQLSALAIESRVAASPVRTLDLDFALNHSLWASCSIGLGHQRNRAKWGCWMQLPMVMLDMSRYGTAQNTHWLHTNCEAGYVMLCTIWDSLTSQKLWSWIMSRCAQNTMTNFTHWAQDSNKPMQLQMGKKQNNLVSINDWYSVADVKLQILKLNPGATCVTEQKFASTKLASFRSCMTSKESSRLVSRVSELGIDRSLTNCTQVVKLDMLCYVQNTVTR